MNRRTIISTLLGVGLVAMGFASPALSAEVTIRAITALPKDRVTNKPFWNFFEEINAKGKGLIQIRYIGGPEAIPVDEQMDALARGIYDLFYGPASYFGGRVPETTAVNASDKTAMELRENGGIALLSEAYRKRANAEYLAYFGSGYQLTIFLTQPPRRTADGGVDLKGLKLRGSTVFQPFMRDLGVNMIAMPVPQMYTALERGVVEGVAWTTVVGGAGWDKFLKHRVRPFFYQGDMGMIINANALGRLSGQARAFLNEMVVKHEKLGHQWFADAEKADSKRLVGQGMQEVQMSEAAARAFRARAYNALWNSMEGRLSEQEVAALRAKFYRGN